MQGADSAIPFDLNTERVLDHWSPVHAVREIIANALDEQTLTNTRDIEMRKDTLGQWNIRDFGRGLRIEHFTQNESPEKLRATGPVIGKYGVGLKDALAVLSRSGVVVNAKSRYGLFRLGQRPKEGFKHIDTLHVLYLPRNETEYVGTVFVLAGLDDAVVSDARGMFLRFSGQTILESTECGDIVDSAGQVPSVYIMGVAVNREPGFAYSYNVTKVTDSMRKEIGRERANVGRAVYSDRVKEILLRCNSAAVLERLADAAEMRDRSLRELPDELTWIDVRTRVLGLAHQRKSVVYVTQSEAESRTSLVDSARREGRTVIVVTEQEKRKLQDANVASGAGNTLLEDYADQYRESFRYSFVSASQLTTSERAVFDLREKLFEFVNIKPMPEVRVSETLREDTQGAWEAALGYAVIRRDALQSASVFCGVLLHELVHAASGLEDVSRDFEGALTEAMGRVAGAYCTVR